MFKKIKQIRKAIRLVEEDEKSVDEFIDGDGKAVFMSDGDQEDYEQYIEDQRGWTQWLKDKFK